MILILHRFCHLISRFCLFIYFAFIHRIHKFIIRKYTNTCEIERLILSKNLKGLILSIKRSKELPKLRKALLSSIISSEDLEELYKIKNIPRNQPIIENAFKKINNLLNGKEYIEYLRKTAYDSNNIELEDKLMDLWKMLRPEKKIQARISKDWSINI